MNDINVIESDCFSVSLNKLDKIDIYFFDGDHTYDAQKKALTYYYDVLNNDFIFVVDDWNFVDAQTGTYDAIKELNLKIKFMTILPSKGNGDWDNYWNGIGLFLLEK